MFHGLTLSPLDPPPNHRIPPPHLLKTHFDKLKSSSRAAITIDPELWSSAQDGMTTSLYVKFLGKSLPLDQAKLALTDTWRGLGDFSVADLPNGYYYIKCSTQNMYDQLLWEGPWTVTSRILQLSPWRACFQPAFERLSTVAV